MNDVVDGLVQAVNSGRTDIVRSVISTCETEDFSDTDLTLDKVLNSPITDDGTILHLAAKGNKTDIVRALLLAGADPCVQNQEQKTPLDLTSSSKVQHVFNDQLLQCIAKSNVGAICQLLAAGVGVNLLDSETNRNTPLHWAACYGNQEVIECLCNRGASVVAGNSEGATPLHDAVLREDPKIVQELLHWGAGATLHTKAKPGKYKGQSPMELALDNPAVVDVLQKASEQLHITNGVDALEFSYEGVPMDQIANTDSASIIATVPSDLNISSTTTITQPQKPVSNGYIPTAKDLPTPPTTPIETSKTEEPPLVLNLSAQSSLAEDAPEAQLQYLWPQPHKVICRSGRPFTLVHGTLEVFLHCGTHSDILSEALRVWLLHGPAFGKLDLEFHVETINRDQTPDVPHVLCEVNRKLFSVQESYRISVTQHQIKVQASDSRGLHCALGTLYQLCKLHSNNGIPNIQIHDHPTLHNRGVLLDMSKGRIAQFESIKNLIRTFCQLKINQVQIYHRFCIPKDPSIKWQFPFTRSALLHLSQFCKDHFIELVPVLDITPRVSIEDLDILFPVFQAFLTCFPHASYVSTGPRLSSFLIEVTEEGHLSLEDTERFIPLRSDQSLQLCAFVFHDIPEVIHQLPCNVTVAEYGFQASYDFQKHSTFYQENGVPFYLVSGTAAWNSLAGCPEAAVCNIYNAVQHTQAQGGLGMLISHWSGVSHLTHQTMVWPGIIAGAGLMWNSSTQLDFLHGHLAELVNRHVLGDIAGIAGQVIVELGRAETYLLRCARNQAGSDNSDLPAEKGTTLYQLLSHPDQVDLEHLTVDNFQKTMRHIRKCQSELTRASLQSIEGEAMLSELQITTELMLTACRVGRQLVNIGKKPSNVSGSSVVNLGVANLVPTTKTDLANRLLSHVETFRSVWLSRNLPQGLQDSLLVLSTMLKQFMPEGGMPKD